MKLRYTYGIFFTSKNTFFNSANELIYILRQRVNLYIRKGVLCGGGNVYVSLARKKNRYPRFECTCLEWLVKRYYWKLARLSSTSDSA